MEKKLLGLISGAISAVALLGPARAETAPAPALAASSFEDLLTPVPNAEAVLRASDDALATQENEPTVQLAQYDHHHHHRFVVRRRYNERHHHHQVIIRRRGDDHHHHHFIRRFFYR